MADIAIKSGAETLENILGGTFARKAAITVLGSLFLAAMSQASVGWPIPMTLQTLAVMLIGVTFGFRLATATVALYLIEGAIGLPVFADFGNLAVLIAKPYTAGYLVGFLFAAALMGFLADRGVTKSWIGMIATLFAGEVVIFGFGVAFLAYLIGYDAAIKGGLYPFLVPDLIKLALAALIAKGVLSGASRFAKF